MKALFWAAAALAAAAASAPALATNMVINGSFDQPSVGGAWGQYTAIPGWTSDTGDFIEIGRAGVYGATCFTPGCQVLEVNANRLGSVSQVVTGLKVGSAYELGWAFAGRANAGPQWLDVLIDGRSIAVQHSNGFAGWLEKGHRFVADAAEARITFASRDVGGRQSYGNLITDVQVAGVPEPGAWAMFITGFGMIGGAVRRRRQAATA